MKYPNCPYCSKDPAELSHRPKVIRAGFFRRSSDSRRIQRFHCRNCGRFFSRATGHPCFKQHKRHFNFRVARFLVSCGSQRRAAKLFHLSRTTIARKLDFVGNEAAQRLVELNASLPQVATLEFDDLETFEHTKCKPLSVTLAVEHKTRRIVGFRVAKMSAKGRLVKKALKKYGHRRDERTFKRRELFKSIRPYVTDRALIKSDENPYYVKDVKEFFPLSVHERHKGQRGAVTGQGELKKIGFDPLFSLNHTCAMLRANINRLVRKTWCTTKKAQKLEKHIAIYAIYHNLVLIHLQTSGPVLNVSSYL